MIHDFMRNAQSVSMTICFAVKIKTTRQSMSWQRAKVRFALFERIVSKFIY